MQNLLFARLRDHQQKLSGKYIRSRPTDFNEAVDEGSSDKHFQLELRAKTLELATGVEEEVMDGFNDAEIRAVSQDVFKIDENVDERSLFVLRNFENFRTGIRHSKRDRREMPTAD